VAAGNPNYDALLSTTLQNYRKQFVDNLSKAFLLFWWLTTGDRKTTRNGGESITVPLMYGKNTTVRSYSGYEVLDTTPQEGLTSVNFPWKQLAGAVSISRLEERQNSGEAQLINLLQSKVTQAEITMRDELNIQLFGDGTGNDSKDLFGLQLLVENLTGTSQGTFGGIDRSDPLNAWWRNQVTLTAGDFDGDNLAKMRTMYNNCSRGNEHPDFIMTYQTWFEEYEGLLQAGQRFVDTRTADAGFENLRFKGAVIGFDENCESDVMYFLNSNYLEFVVDAETDLITTPFIRPENQDARVSQILLMGNFLLSNSARQGVIDGWT